MKRLVQITLLSALGLFVAGAALAYNPSLNGYVPGAGILKTPHDLGALNNGGMGYQNPSDPLNRTCIFCHAPHNTYKLSQLNGGPGDDSIPPAGAGGTAPDEYTYLPLWNHAMTTLQYTMYQNGPGGPQSGPKASQAIEQNPTSPGPTSLLCLSCHDGSVAVNSYGNAAQLPHSRGPLPNAGTFIADVYNIGGKGYLGNHHPIGFNYVDAATQDKDLRDPTQVSFNAGDLVSDHLYGGTQMECATCHSVHNKGNTGETLLWRTDASSGLCLTCHAK